MSGIKLLGTGSYIPPVVVNNEDLSKIVDTSDEWIVKRTGMKERHLTGGEPTWYMGAEAAKKALAKSGVAPSDIDLTIFTTVTGDFVTPSMASIAAHELGLENSVCFDVNGACSGFVYALDMARRYLATGDCKNVLIISAETLSSIVDYTDRSSCVLFGDGAGACVVTGSDKLYSSYLGSDLSGTTKLYARGREHTHPFMGERTPMEDSFELQDNFMHMDGKEVYKFATAAMPFAVEQACTRAEMTVDELALIVPHQANTRIVETATKKLGISQDKIFCNIERYGNTSSASIPICLDEIASAKRLKSGDKVCMVGFGAGLTYGAVIFEY